VGKPKSKRLLTVACLAVLAVAITIWLSRTNEPQYSGRPLSEWLADYNSPGVLNWPRGSHPADAAIRALGTNCFPAIIDRLRMRDSNARRRVLRFARAIRVQIPIATQERAHTEALAALGALGLDAAPLVLELANSLEVMHFSHRAVAGFWLERLESNAEAAIPTFLGILRDQGNQLPRLLAVETLAAIGARQTNLVLPVLKACLNDSNPAVRLQAANALTRQAQRIAPAKPLNYGSSNLFQLQIGTDAQRAAAASFFFEEPILPHLVIPLLHSNLFGTNIQLVETSAKALGAYGGRAQDSSGALSNLLSHPKRYVRLAASNALQRIQISRAVP
jgi:hypothetical protein